MPPPTQHGHDAVFRAAPLALDQQMPGHARARHAIGMADGNRAAGYVEPVIGNAEPVAAIQYLHGESLIEFPDADIIHA